MKKQRSVHVSNCTKTEETTHEVSGLRTPPAQNGLLCLRILVRASDVSLTPLSPLLSAEDVLAKRFRQLVDFRLWRGQLHGRGQVVGES